MGVGGGSVNSARPVAINDSPDRSVARAPKRALSRAEKLSENTPISSATGRNASPISTGPAQHPLHVQRSQEEHPEKSRNHQRLHRVGA